MNRKLLLLDIVLGIAVIYSGFQLHREWSSARARQAATPGPPPKIAPVPPMPPLPAEPAVMASGYKDVALHNLFDASRNPDVPVEPPPPPPPPKEPPPPPGFHGMMDFGDKAGPVALITDTQTPGYLQVHAGEKIGEFKLLSFNHQEMTLDWEGRVIHKRLGEGGDAQPKQAPRAPPMEPITTNGVIPGQAPKVDTTPPPRQNLQPLGPGIDLGDGVRACQQGDGSAPGTVTDGYVKQSHATPLGSTCIWRAIGK